MPVSYCKVLCVQRASACDSRQPKSTRHAAEEANKRVRQGRLLRVAAVKAVVHEWIGHSEKTSEAHCQETTQADQDAVVEALRVQREASAAEESERETTEADADDFGRILDQIWTKDKIEKVLIPAVSGAFINLAKTKTPPVGLEPTT